MARRGRTNVALAASLTVGAVLVLFELIVRNTSLAESSARTPSSLVSEVLSTTTGISIVGWPALILPILVVLFLGLLIDALSGMGR